MNLETKTEIKPTRIESTIIYAEFDEALEILNLINYEFVSLRQIAQLRVSYGKEHEFSKNENLAREGILYVPKKGIFLTKNSPILDNAKEAVRAHKNGREYFLTDEQFEQSLTNSVRLVGRKIPTNRFKENEITAFAFGNFAEKYGNFLYESGIKEMSVYLANFSDKPFARQMKFMELESNSAFNSIGKFFGDIKELKVCGVKNIK